MTARNAEVAEWATAHQNKSIPVSVEGLGDGVELVPGLRTSFCQQSRAGAAAADMLAQEPPGCSGRQRSQLCRRELEQQRLVETLVGQEDGLTACFSSNGVGSDY